MSLSFQSSSCYQETGDRVTKIDLVEGDKGLLIYFKTNIPPNAPYEFENTVLSEPHPEGKGFSSLPGIVEGFALEPISGHKGVAAKFRNDATKKQIDYVKARVNASPIVFRIFENIPPSRIKETDLKD